MGKPKRTGSGQVDILHFPFMAVLSCIIGALAFILFIFIAHSKDLVDTSQIEDEILGSKDKLELKKEQMERLKEQLLKDREFLANRKIPELKDRRRELEELRQKVAALEKKEKEFEMRLVKEDTTDQVRESELDELRKKATMIKASRSVVAEVKHAGSVETLPIYIECRENEAVVWPAGKSVTMADKNIEEKSLDEWLEHAGVPKHGNYVVFLIRPSGIATFESLRAISENSEFKVGYEPVLNEWELFFS
ncbi:MAG: hypothetical protein JW941_13045 [Candidatus Coatesbacteria bacterium]|nr:hypothetical protein [Candidatus Coatesbacteria bacterium]